MLGAKKQDIEGLRPFEEIDGKIKSALTIKKNNPGRIYNLLSTLGGGVLGKVFLA